MQQTIALLRLSNIFAALLQNFTTIKMQLQKQRTF